MQLQRSALVVTTLASLAVLSPLLHGNDSFPLSNYPMFSNDVHEITDIELVVGLDQAGERVTLSPQLIANTDEVIQAGSFVRSEIRNGRADELCRQVLTRTSDDENIVSIVVLTDSLNSVEWYAGRTTPSKTVVHATCGSNK